MGREISDQKRLTLREEFGSHFVKLGFAMDSARLRFKREMMGLTRGVLSNAEPAVTSIEKSR